MNGSRRETGAFRRLGSWLGWFTACWVLWLVMAGSLSTSELVAGAAIAAVAATTAGAVRDPAMRASDLLAHAGRLGRALLSVPRDLARMPRVLGRELTGRASRGEFEVVPFDPGAAGDPRAHARRVLEPVAQSLSPNAYVVAVDRDAGLMLVHRLTPDAVVR